MFRTKVALLSFFLSLALAAGSLSAQTIVTPSNPNGWNVTIWGSSSPAPFGGFTNVFPRNGNGSAELNLADEGTSEVDFEYELPTPGALSGLNQLSFDWYASSASTTPSWTTPAFAMYLSNDVYVIWEGAYNGYMPNAPQDTWISSNILNDNFWISGSGAASWTGSCAPASAYQPLSWFQQNCFDPAADVQVTWLVPFLGYGYPGTQFRGAFDNISYGFLDGPSEQFNFEADPSTVVPEPATMTLLATGLVGIAGARRRKRRNPA